VRTRTAVRYRAQAYGAQAGRGQLAAVLGHRRLGAVARLEAG